MQSVTIFIFFCFLTQNTQLISKSFLTNISDIALVATIYYCIFIELLISVAAVSLLWYIQFGGVLLDTPILG